MKDTEVTIWHNPQCSKSRTALEILKHSNAKVESDVSCYFRMPIL